MPSSVYRVTEVVGTSQVSIDDAVRGAITRANETIRNLDWFEVTQIRGQIADGEVAYIQVGLKLGFKLEPAT